MVDVLSLVDHAVGREQLASENEEEKKRIMQEFEKARIIIERNGDRRVSQDKDGKEMKGDDAQQRSAWANGLFYLFAFVIVCATLAVIARSVSLYALPLVLIAGVIFVPVIGALQLKMDGSLPDKSFLQLMGMAIGQLPLIGRLVTRTPGTEGTRATAAVAPKGRRQK
jgi:Flp pilus assembly protein TadB